MQKIRRLSSSFKVFMPDDRSLFTGILAFRQPLLRHWQLASMPALLDQYPGWMAAALPASVIARAVRPLGLGKPASEIYLKETNFVLVGFGESFAPAKTSRPCEDCRSYLWPPECRFGPSSPLSFSTNIRCLGIALWDLIARESLFNDHFVSPESVVAPQVDVLGSMPLQW